MTPTLKTKYKDAVAPKLMETQGYSFHVEYPELDITLCTRGSQIGAHYPSEGDSGSLGRHRSSR